MSGSPRPGSLVVGGASGIGAAVAAQARRAGGAVVVWDIAGESDIRCDIADERQVEEAMRRTVASIGAPQRVTVSAGVGSGGALLDVASAEWDRVFDVNVRGVWLSMRAAARALVEAGTPGSIVAVSSVSATLADRSMGAYCASKAALDMVVRVAAAEWGEHGVRVNAVAPGVTRTPMLGPIPTDRGWLAEVQDRTALGRLGEAADIAAAVEALHGLGWVTGQSLVCDGGLALQSPIDPLGAWRRSANPS